MASARRSRRFPDPTAETGYLAQAERIVALLRVPAIVLIAEGDRISNPDEPVWFPSPEHVAFFTSVVVYLILSLGVLAWVQTRPVGRRFALATTALDIAAITALTVTSGGPYSETRLAYFVVPVVAAFRFRPSLTALAGGAGVVAYLTQSFTHPASHAPEAPRFIAVHAGYLTWVGLGAVILSMLLQRRTETVWRLAKMRESLLNELLTAEERERQALAESIHDHVIQNLLSVRHELDEASAQQVCPALDRADTTISESVTELREIVSTLHPFVLEEAGLAASLRLLADRAARRGGFVVRLDVDGDSPAGPDDRLLIGVARELLGNVATHARARRVSVKLGCDGDERRLIVTDDGVGFDPARLSDHVASGHIGLASQRLRVESAGGRLEVVSEPHRGSTVVVRLPLQAPPATPEPQRGGRPLRPGLPHA